MAPGASTGDSSRFRLSAAARLESLPLYRPYYPVPRKLRQMSSDGPDLSQTGRRCSKSSRDSAASNPPICRIGADGNADGVGPKTFFERNAYLIFSIGSCNRSRRGSIEHDADLAGRALIGDAIGLVGMLQRVAVRDDAIWVKVPAHEVLKQFFHVTQ